MTSCDQNTAAGALAAAVTVQRRYDSLGRTLMESLQIDSGAAVRAVETSFNSNYKWKQKYPGGRVITCDYDHGRLETVSDVDGAGDPATPAIAQYAYQGGRVCERTMGNGVNLEVTFNEAGFPATWRHRRASDSAVLIGFDNYYDAAGNKTMRVATHDANDTQRYAYDSDNRLTAFSRGDAAVTSGVPDLCSAPADTWASATQAQFWDLDGLGNWVQTVTKVNGQSTTVNRTADNFNAYTQVDSVSYSYDENGNLTYDGEKTFAWDKFNRLVSASDTTGTLVTYLYDSNRRRVKKIFPTGSEFSNVEYAYTGWQIAAEYADAGTYPQRQYVYGNYIDEPLIMDVNEDNDASCYILDGTVDTTDSRYYYHQDTLYSVCAITNDSGTMLETYQYDAYGHFRVLSDSNGITSIANYDNEDWIAQGPSSVANTFTHTGREFDQETGLWNFRNRYKQERFVSRDRNGYVDGPNLYQYAISNPCVLNDPFGLDAGITASSETAVHSGIAVEVWYCGKVVGYLTADFAAKGYVPGESSSCADLGDAADNFSVKGSLSITFIPANKLGGVIRIAKGDINKDHHLAAWLLDQVGKDKKWLKTETINYTRPISQTLDTAGAFDKYRVCSQNCNDFTDKSLDTYLGYNWCSELITDAADLIQQWDERYNTDGTKKE